MHVYDHCSMYNPTHVPSGNTVRGRMLLRIVAIVAMGRIPRAFPGCELSVGCGLGCVCDLLLLSVLCYVLCYVLNAFPSQEH